MFIAIELCVTRRCFSLVFSFANKIKVDNNNIIIIIIIKIIEKRFMLFGCSNLVNLGRSCSLLPLACTHLVLLLTVFWRQEVFNHGLRTLFPLLKLS